ncbi:hypothetical protein D918_05645 [Trichuris suis]|nr:hypothetical protein D918_05645 [Trichuris suis]
MENSISKRKVLMKEALYREKLTELESCSKYVTAVSHHGGSVTDAFWIARNQLKRVGRWPVHFKFPQPPNMQSTA